LRAPELSATSSMVLICTAILVSPYCVALVAEIFRRRVFKKFPQGLKPS
jgi:hypothetical protein